jgi:hypothetical protein
LTHKAVSPKCCTQRSKSLSPFRFCSWLVSTRRNHHGKTTVAGDRNGARGGYHAAVPLRARAAAQRAKRELKAAQDLAQAEKMVADGTSRSIADVKPGDVVMTYDIGYGEIVGKPVAGTYSVQSNHLYTVNNDLKTTGGEGRQKLFAVYGC